MAGPIAPERPARPDEDHSPRLVTESSSSPRYNERAMSPTGSLQQRRNMTPTGQAPYSHHHVSPAVSGPSPPQQDIVRIASPSQLSRSDTYDKGAHRTTTNGSAPPSDAFYYGARPNAPSGFQDPLRPRDGDSDALKTRERWLNTALSLAIEQGFVVPTDLKVEGGNLESSVPSVDTSMTSIIPLESLLALKAELAAVKVRVWPASCISSLTSFGALAIFAERHDRPVSSVTRRSGSVRGVASGGFEGSFLLPCEAGSARDRVSFVGDEQIGTRADPRSGVAIR
jgi:hypothetical protein